MNVLLGSPRGYCAGVARALDIVELCLERLGAPIYVRHEIIHNPHVVDELRNKGAVFVENLSEVPIGHTVIFSAHGVSPIVRDEAKKRNLNIIDATCPLVTKVHVEALKYAGEGYSIILVGHKDHDEVIGTTGHAPKHTILVETIDDARKIEIKNPNRVVALTQTTLSVTDTAEIIEVLKHKFPKLLTRNDICYATTNRQTAVKELAKKVDIVLVVGANNSSNSLRLREAAEAAGLPAYLVNDPKDVREAWLTGAKRIGVTSGASTPEWLVNEVVLRLKPNQVDMLPVMEENVTFILPKELRLGNNVSKKTSV